MTAFIYPENDLQKPDVLLGVLGSFWSDTYAGRSQVRSYTRARGNLEEQGYNNLREAENAISRRSLPVFHTQRWYQLVLKKSDHNSTEGALLAFDDGANFGDPHFYGVVNQTLHTYPLPANMVHANALVNRLTETSLTLLEGVDFVINRERNLITFAEDPLDNLLFETQEIWCGDQVCDTEALLWAFNAEFDYSYLQEQHGYVLEASFKSSQLSKDLVNAAIDAVVGGTAKEQVEQALSAMMDIPLAVGNETVEVITPDRNHLLVMTDKRVYRFNKVTTAAVEIGDVLEPGQSMVDAFQVHALNRGTVSSAVRAVALGHGYLAAGFTGELQFDNKEVDLEVLLTTDSGNNTDYTKIKFEVGGHPFDVDKFFNDIHAAGIADGQTLAHLMDTRTTKVGEPVASNLPAKINPLGFMVKNVLRNNVFIVTAKVRDFGDNALRFEHAHLLRRIIPPHTSMLLLLELQGFDDSVTMSSSVETLGTFTGTEFLNDQVLGVYPGDNLDGTIGVERVTARNVARTCQ
jgi:hypothetical protein